MENSLFHYTIASFIQKITDTVKAIILAAGIGNRLGKLAGGLPKCLLEFDGQSLLLRHIRSLEQHPLSTLTVVTGFQHQRILDELAGIKTNLHIETVYNPDFRSGSIISLYTAVGTLDSGEDILLMDADVLYHPRILDILIMSSHANCFLLDRRFAAGEEPVKLCVSEGKLIDFRKQIDRNLRYDFQGESAGFFRFSPVMATRLAECSRNYIDSGRKDEPYEEAIRDLLLANPDDFGYEDITGIPWLEIDFPEDVLRARQDILPRINSSVKNP